MRTIVVTDPGVVELNFMWLPTFIGMNNRLKIEIEEKLKAKIVGKEITEESLDEINLEVMDFLIKKFPISGLGDYLIALKSVRPSWIQKTLE